MKNEKLTKVKEKAKSTINKIKNNSKKTSAKKSEATFDAKTTIENQFASRINIVEIEKQKLEEEKRKLKEEYKDLDDENVDEIKVSDISLYNDDKKKNNKKSTLKFKSISKKTITLYDIKNAIDSLKRKNNKKSKSKKKIKIKFIETIKAKLNIKRKKKNDNEDSIIKKRKNFISEFIKGIKRNGKKNKGIKKISKDKVISKIDFSGYYNKNTFLFATFIIIFLFLFVSMLIPMPENSEISSRVKSNLIDTEKLTGIKKVESDIENAIIVKFPWYEEILDGYFGAMEVSNRSLYENANDNELILIDNKNGIYIDKNEDQLIRKYEVEEKDQDVELAHRVKLFNAMSDLLKKKNVNAYIYAVSGIWTSEAILNFELDYKEPLKYVKLFEEKIDDYIHFDYLKIIDYTTFKKYFFATDHHWRIHGAYQGYKDICKMLNISDDEIVKPNFFKVEGVEFMGSNAKFCSHDNIVDYLYDIEFDDSQYTVKINGNESDVSELSKKDEYLKGEFEKDDEYYNHYAKYFHSDLAEIVYTYDKNKDSNKNLLLIGDSYSNCIDKEIASHFYNTYVIDLRYYESVMGEKFVLEKYIDENNITDVLVMLSANSIYFESADLDLGIEGVSGVKENGETK